MQSPAGADESASSRIAPTATKPGSLGPTLLLVIGLVVMILGFFTAILLIPVGLVLLLLGFYLQRRRARPGTSPAVPPGALPPTSPQPPPP